MKKFGKVALWIVGIFIVMGLLFGGCTALFVSSVDDEIQKEDKKSKEESKKTYDVGTTKTFEDVDVTVDGIEEVAPPEYAEKQGTFYKVSFTIQNNSSEDAMFSSGDFKMQANGKQFDEEFGYEDSFDLDTVNSGNEVTGQSYFVDTKGTTEQPKVQLSFSPFMFDTHKANWK